MNSLFHRVRVAGLANSDSTCGPISMTYEPQLLSLQVQSRSMRFSLSILQFEAAGKANDSTRVSWTTIVSEVVLGARLHRTESMSYREDWKDHLKGLPHWIVGWRFLVGS